MSPQHQQWLGELYDRMIGRVWGYALAILADRPLAEDAVQQAFVKLARRLGEGPILCPEGYLLIAVRNEAYRLAKSQARQRHDYREGDKPKQADDLWLEPLPGVLLEEELRRQVQQAMERLPPEQREVVYLKIWENLTFQQVAQRLEISINTAASRYRYATDKLERLLGPYLESES